MTVKKRKPGKVENSRGQVYYGRHMYPGVAEYRPSRHQMFRLLIKEPAIRKMGTTFPGRPLFVHHNEHFSDELDKLRTEADGWVSDSFYNEADGAHWAKILLVTDRAIKAQEEGYGLSNAYDFKRVDETPGVYNGLDYDFEVLDGEYKHMALVPNPRYDSVLLTPEEFKRYNEEQRAGLKRVANSNDRGRFTMKKRSKTGSKFSISLFKKTKVENSKDLAEMSVLLPDSKKEMTIAELVEIADGVMNSKNKTHICNASDLVITEDDEGNEEEITVGELWEEVQDLRARVQEIEGDMYEEESEDDDVENEDDDYERDEVENEDDDSEEETERKPKKKAAKKSAKNSREERYVFRNRVSNDDDEESDDDSDISPRNTNRRIENKSKKPQTAKNQRDENGDRRKSKSKADRARNAADRYDRDNQDDNVIKISTIAHQLQTGMDRYGKL